MSSIVVAPRSRGRQEGKKKAADMGDVCRAIDAGADFSALQEQFGEAALAPTLTKLLHRKPQRMREVFGEAASDRRILFDVCFGHALPVTELVHQAIGIPQASEFFMTPPGGNGRGATDNQIVREATATGITAIFSCDTSTSGKDDLCVVARRKFQTYDPAKHEHVPPGIVLFPHGGDGAESRLDVLRTNRDEIIRYLDRHAANVAAGTAGVLDLR